jgi:tripartite-type tricarboxylate transporter receptor subunit TctC
MNREDRDKPPAALHRRTLLSSGLVLAGMTAPAAAQSAYPNRPVRVLVNYSPGGAADSVARIVFAKLSERLGQPFVVENRPGGGGTIGASVVAHAAPDGYTIMHEATAFTINPSFLPSLPYDSDRDFRPVYHAVMIPVVISVNPRSPIRDVADVIQRAKASRSGLNCGSSGVGSAQHIALEMFARRAEIRLNHVPYRGGAPMLSDLIGGQLDLGFDNLAGSANQARAGAIHILAHGAAQRLPSLPDLPTIAETLPGYEAADWNGVLVPKGTPEGIIARLNAGLTEAMKDPAVLEKLAGLNIVPAPSGLPESFEAFLRRERAKWGEIVRAANIRPE